MEHGVKQGSVLSPTLSIAVIHSPLTFLNSCGQGLTISCLNVGNSAHADGVRAASIGINAAMIQGKLVDSFCDVNCLKLNATRSVLQEKTRLFLAHRCQPGNTNTRKSKVPRCVVAIHSPTTSVQECILKAQCAFFALGSIGSFQGKIKSLTGCSLFETFVVLTMLYGCRTWILSESHLSTLETFQAEIGKPILGLPKHHSNLTTLIELHWPSVRCRILIWKLRYLAKLLSSDDRLNAEVFCTPCI